MEPVALRTGQLSAVLVDGALRDVRIGGHCVLDAVYVAVRDTDWGTLPTRLGQYTVNHHDDGFSVGFTASNGDGFRWQGRLDGRAGTLVFEFAGEALGDLAANRIGFCLLHPIEMAGRPVLVRTEQGERPGAFPDRIAPRKPFTDLTGLSYEVAGGARADIAFAGELFEMEDHRNWTDAGFKTYCTPVRRPYPVRHKAGDRIGQQVRIAGHVDGPAPPSPSPVLSIRVGEEIRGRLPDVDHSYVEVSPDQLGDLTRAPGTALDVAVLMAPGIPPDGVAASLASLGERLRRVSVFDTGTRITAPGTVAALRTALRRLNVQVPVGGGTTANFAELNEMSLDADELDFVVFGINPRVHHDDDALVMDTLLAQPHVLRDATLIAGGRPVVVRVTPGGGGEFGAAWTVGSLAALGGAAAVTYRFDEPIGSPLDKLPSLSGASVYAVDASPRELAAVAVDGLLLAANLRPVARDVDIDGQSTRLGPYATLALPR